MIKVPNTLPLPIQSYLRQHRCLIGIFYGRAGVSLIFHKHGITLYTSNRKHTIPSDIVKVSVPGALYNRRYPIERKISTFTFTKPVKGLSTTQEADILTFLRDVFLFCRAI